MSVGLSTLVGWKELWLLLLSLLSVGLYGIKASHGLGGVTTSVDCRAVSGWCSLVDSAMTGRVYRSTLARSHRRCWAGCTARPRCRSVNYASQNGTCEFLESTYHENLGFVREMRGWVLSYSPNNTFGCAQQPTRPNRPDPTASGWPVGTYGLPMPIAGCPNNTGFSWQTGFRFHDTEDSQANNEWSADTHLRGPLEKNDMTQHFCMKTVVRSGTRDRNWPPGNYCVFQYGTNCSEGMSSGSIYWSDQDWGSNRADGTLPSGAYGDSNTRLDYCCMSTGDPTQPMELPTDGGPFYLFPVIESHCQEVRGMTATLEWFKWDNEDDKTSPSPSGTYPLHTLFTPYNNLKIYYCYYQAMGLV